MPLFDIATFQMELTSPMHGAGGEREYNETENASVVTTNHYLNDVSDFGFWKTEKAATPKNDEEPAEPRKV